MEAVIIDFHTHIFPPRVIERRADLLEKDPCLKALYSNPRAKMASLEELISSMDRDGIDMSVVLNIGWSDLELCRETNDYILEAATRYPERLVGFCMVDPKSDWAPKELERCLKGGTRGIGELRPDLQGFNPAEGSAAVVFELAAKNELLALTHASEPVGHLYPGKGEVTPDILYRFATLFPELCLICAHWGGGLPFYALMPEVAQALQKVFFDTAATPFLYEDAIFSLASQLVGPHKILFGSDYPLISQGRIIRQLERLDLPQPDRESILGGNARQLLKLGHGEDSGFHRYRASRGT